MVTFLRGAEGKKIRWRNTCGRFADSLAAAGARLEADVTRYVFIAVDSHHLLSAGLPAHW